MTEVTIKFKDRSRSNLKLKTPVDGIDYFNGLVRIPLATNGKVHVIKAFSVDSIEEITEVIREEENG